MQHVNSTYNFRFDDAMTVKDALEEIEEIQTQQKKFSKRSKYFAVCEQWSNVKHLIICVLIFSCRPASGRIPILVHPYNYYKLFVLPVSIEIATLFQGILEFFFSLLNVFVADVFPRKSMLQIVCWIMFTCLMVSYFQVTLVGMLGIFGEWINLISLMVYIGLACGPLMSLTLVTVTEIASTATNVRGIIQATCQFCNNLMNAILTSFFPFVLVSMPVNYVLLFMFANLVTLSLLVTLVPETVGMALHKCEWEVRKVPEEQLLSEIEDQDLEDDTRKLISP